jgi:hypothetical protein
MAVRSNDEYICKRLAELIGLPAHAENKLRKDAEAEHEGSTFDCTHNAKCKKADHEITTCTALRKAVVKLAHQAEVRPDSMLKTCLTLFYHNE